MTLKHLYLICSNSMFIRKQLNYYIGFPDNYKLGSKKDTEFPKK